MYVPHVIASGVNKTKTTQLGMRSIKFTHILDLNFFTD